MAVNKYLLNIKKAFNNTGNLLINHFRENWLLDLQLLIAGFIVSVFSFRGPDLFYPGIDSSLIWVFNHLFNEGLQAGQHIIFPHGPLAFLMYPTVDNLLIAFIVTVALKTLMLAQIFRLSKNSDYKWFISIIITLIICTIAHFNLLIIFNVMLAYMLYFHSRLNTDKFIGLLLTAFAIYVKAYVGIVSLAISGGFWIYFLIKEKNFKKSISELAVGFVMLILLWLIMFGSFKHFINFFVGLLQLAQDNSAAAAYYPENNWWYLSIFLILSFGITLWRKDKQMIYMAFLGSFALFAAWKHGMAREDIYHTKKLLAYVIIYFFLIWIYVKKHKYIYIITGIVAILAFYINMQNVRDYKELNYNFSGINSFISWTFNNKDFVKNNQIETEKRLEAVKLSDEYRNIIDNATVDIYPWDYSVIAANNLNWQARPVIQSYASYSKWLDKQNSNFLNSDKAPKYIIWDMQKETPNIYGGNLESLDYRYLLNDEPLFLLELFRNYQLWQKDGRFFIYTKRSNKPNIIKETLNAHEIAWNQWLETPDYNGKILQAHVNFTKNISGKLKSFFFKDEMVYLEIKLENGLIHKHRIVPKNAEYGLWINPYLNNLSRYISPQEIKAIRFVSSNNDRFKDIIEIEWVNVSFENKDNTNFNFLEFWDISKLVDYSENIFELNLNNTDSEHWVSVNSDLITYSEQNNTTIKVPAKSFSPTFVYTTDSTGYGSYFIQTNLQLGSLSKKVSKDIVYVISTENTENNIWNGLSIADQLISDKYSNSVFHQSEIRLTSEKQKLKIYIWNNSDKDIFVGNFIVSIQKLD
jgi:hypothetical protein